jgi:hypothetical protein
MKLKKFVDNGKRLELNGLPGKRMPIPYDKTVDSKYGHVQYALNAQIHAPSRKYCCEWFGKMLNETDVFGIHTLAYWDKDWDKDPKDKRPKFCMDFWESIDECGGGDQQYRSIEVLRCANCGAVFDLFLMDEYEKQYKCVEKVRKSCQIETVKVSSSGRF